MEKNKILIIEDDELSLLLIKLYLNKVGITESDIIFTGVGIEGVELYKANKDSIRFVLVDWGLVGIDGIEVTKEILRIQYVPIIMETALSTIGDREKCLAVGCIAYLSKPYTEKEFIDVLKDFELI